MPQPKSQGLLATRVEQPPVVANRQDGRLDEGQVDTYLAIMNGPSIELEMSVGRRRSDAEHVAWWCLTRDTFTS